MLVFTMLLAAGCRPSPEFAEWTLDVPAGVAVIEHRVRPLDDRAPEPIRLVEELVLGESPGPTFYNPSTMAASADGRLYVLDAGNDRVVVFTNDGELFGIIGGPGQGPGEFQLRSSQSIGASHDKLRVDDRGNARLSIWDLDGNFIETRPSITTARYHFWSGLPSGNRIAFATERTEEEEEAIIVYDDDSTELFRLAQRPRSPGLPSKRHDYTLNVLSPTLRYAVAPDGRIYLHDLEYYQVYAFNESGDMEWALRTDYEPMPVPEDYKRWLVELRRQNPRVSDLQVSDFNWPERYPALYRLLVDGHGHLYVMPATFPYFGERDVPADVYSRDGELLYSGTLAGPDTAWNGWWGAAHGDTVYSFRQTPAGDVVVAGSRIEEPW